MKKIVLINEAAVNPKVSLCQQHCMKNSRSCALKMTGSTWMQCQISLVEEVSIIPIDGKCRQRSFLWVVETLWRRFLLSVCFLLVGCVARNRSSSSVSNWYFVKNPTRAKNLPLLLFTIFISPVMFFFGEESVLYSYSLKTLGKLVCW